MYGAREAGSITYKLKDGVVGETLVSLLYDEMRFVGMLTSTK